MNKNKTSEEIFSEKFNNVIKNTIDNEAEKRNKKKHKKFKEKNIQVLALNFMNEHTDASFAALVERITWGLRSHIYKVVNDDEATSEVLSKTLENIYFKIDQFNPEIAKFSTWMYRIAFNNALKWKQNKMAKQCLNVDFEDLYDNALSPEKESQSPIMSYTAEDSNIIDFMCKKDSTIEGYDKERVLIEFYDASVKSIEHLPDNLRVVMSDRLLNCKKIEDIAYDNSIPLSSVKNWLRKGKVELQNIIKNNYPELYNMYMEAI